jgi:hypothetical protein
LTGDQRHTDHIATGQQLSRHSLPPLLYFTFFPTAQNILKFSQPTLAHLVLPDTQADPRKTKRANSAQFIYENEFITYFYEQKKNILI